MTANQQASKTAQKKAMRNLQTVGMQLAALPQAAWQQLDLDEKLQLALREYNRLAHADAKKRKRQHIGKLLRNEDTQAIDTHLQWLRNQHRKTTIHAKDLPQLFLQCIGDTQAACALLFARYPQAPRQHIHTLLRHIARDGSKAQFPPANKYQARLWKTLIELETKRHSATRM